MNKNFIINKTLSSKEEFNKSTPIDLGRIIKIKQPTVKVGYELQEIGTPNLEGVLKDFCKKHKLKIKK